MSPVTHLFASWIVGAKTTSGLRDCSLVALCGVLPDADGLPIVADLVNELFGRPETHYYALYHHYWFHGLAAGVVLAALLACFATQRFRVFLLGLAVFHLHLLCDLAGSRGPDPSDLWPVFYYGPFSKEPMWLWKGQWRLDSWFNRITSVFLFFWILKLAVQQGYSALGLFSRRADRAFVHVLRDWQRRIVKYAASAKGED